MLSEKTGGEMADAEKFIRELISLINDGIIRDKMVNVKGIGTFKIVLVKERESVSVNTGERIMIPPHHKLSFIPEKALKDLINKPFASFETIETSDDNTGLANYSIAAKENEQEKTVEREDLPVYEEQPPKEPPRHLSDREVVERTQEEYVVSTPPPLSSEPLPPPLPLSPLPPPPPPPSPPYSPTSTSSPPQHERKGKARKKKSKKSSTKLLLTILFVLLFILIGGGSWYFFFYNKSIDDLYTERLNTRIAGESTTTLSTDSVSPMNEVNTALDSTVNVQPEINEADTATTEVAEQASAPVSTPVAEPPVSSTTQETAPPPTSRPVTTTSPQTTATSAGNNVLARVTIESGQRLTLVSERYYGLKVFWVYIYEFNKEKIGSNPDRIPVGMEILVPTKEMYDIDATSTASVERATALQRRIMAGY